MRRSITLLFVSLSLVLMAQTHQRLKTENEFIQKLNENVKYRTNVEKERESIIGMKGSLHPERPLLNPNKGLKDRYQINLTEIAKQKAKPAHRIRQINGSYLLIDSIIGYDYSPWEEHEKTQFYYTKGDQLDSLENNLEWYKDLQIWENYYQLRIVRDSLKRVTRENSFYWNSEENNFEFSRRKQYYYDEKGNIDVMSWWVPAPYSPGYIFAMESVYYTFNAKNLTDTIETWHRNQREDESVYTYRVDRKTYTYDNSDRVLSYEYGETTTSLADMSGNREVYTYLANGQISKIEFEYQYIINDQKEWRTSGITEFLYDDKDRLISEIKSSFSFILDKIVAEWKEESGYNETGQLSQKISFNFENNQWKASERMRIQYDERGNAIEYTFDKWGGSSWVTNYNYTMTFDQNNNTISAESAVWDPVYEKVEKNEKVEFAFDLNYSKNDVRYFLNWDLRDFAEDETPYNNLLTSYTAYEAINNNYEKLYQLSMFYSPGQTSSVTSTTISAGIIHPNPTTDFIHFDRTGTFNLFDLQGRKMLSMQVEAGSTISIRDINSGVYLYQLKADGIDFRGKVIKN
jgi:hypothetical protein